MLPKLAEFKNLAVGLQPGVADKECRFWQDGRNVLFDEQGIRKMMGWTAANANGSGATAPVRGALQQRVNGVQYLFYGSPGKLFEWNPAMSVGTDRSKAGGYSGQTDETINNPATAWSLEAFGSVILATNGVDAPQKFQIGVDSAFSDLNTGGEFTTAEIFIKRGPHLIAANTSAGGNVVHWCSADDYTDWVPTTSNSAGNLELRDMESDIKAATLLGDAVALYGEDSVHVLQYIGAPNYFGWMPALNGIGAVGKMAVVSVGRHNFGLGEMGFWMTDGASFEIIDDDIRSWFFDRVNTAQLSKVCAYHNERFNQVIWYYPTTGLEPQEGVGFDYKRKVWTVYDHGFSSALERQVFDNPVVWGSNKIYYINFGDNADGAALDAWAETPWLDLGTPFWKYVTQAYIEASEVQPTASLQFASGDFGQTPAFSESVSLSDAFARAPLFMEAARAAKIKLSLSGVGCRARLHRIDLFGRVGGWE